MNRRTLSCFLIDTTSLGGSVPSFSNANCLIFLLAANMDINSTRATVTNVSVTQILISTTLVSLICFIIVYKWKNRNLEKLAAQLPGPPALPIVGNALEFLGSSEENLNMVLMLTSQYDCLCRLWLGHYLIIIIYKPEDIQIVLNSRKTLNKGFAYRFLQSIVGNGLVVAPVDMWRRHRRVIAPAFNSTMLEQFIPLFSKHNKKLVDKLRPQISSGQFDIWKYVSSTILDIVCETICGINERTNEMKSEFAEALHRVSDIFSIRIYKAWMHFDFIFNLTSYNSELKKCLQKICDFQNIMIEEKRKEHKQKKEKKSEQNKDTKTKLRILLDILLELSESDEKFSDEEVRHELLTMIIAGYDTSTQTICFCLLMLAIHQDIQKKVYEEVFRIFGDFDCEVTMESLKQMEYTEMVIKETMRLYPVVPMYLREVQEDIELTNHKLPAGCQVLIMPIAIHMNPKIFPDPEKFNPENFTPERVAERHKYSYLPFSAGPRVCLGQTYAVLSMKTSLAYLIRNYRFFTTTKREDLKLKSDFLLRCLSGFPMKIVRRYK